jgi:hypothetical protein
MGTLIFCQKIPSLAGMTAKVRKERKILSPLPPQHTHTHTLSLSLSLSLSFMTSQTTMPQFRHTLIGLLEFLQTFESLLQHLTRLLKAYYKA